MQIELGRYAISSGKPTLGAIDELPGPRLGAHWLVWWWLFMLLGTVSQLGGMTGGVGQALHLAIPGVSAGIARGMAPLAPDLATAIEHAPEYPWAVLTFLVVVCLLLSGGYRRVEKLSTYLVAGVTLLTVVCVLALCATPFPIHWEEAARGLRVVVPVTGLAVAFGVFGITGVGATELYAYPYWCLEKGYARFAGRREDSAAWLQRARGWVRVMQLDAWCSMVVFTLATVSFYFMGAAVLHPQGLNPQGKDLIHTLSQMYIGPFGLWTQVVFLVGAAAVLFKTLYVSCAGHSRLTADFLSLAGFIRFRDADQRGRWVRGLCVFYPLLALVLFFLFKEPRAMVVFGAVGQAATIPVVSGIALFFRYRRTDPRLAPTRAADVCLWIALVTITCVAVYAVSTQIRNLFPPAGP